MSGSRLAPARLRAKVLARLTAFAAARAGRSVAFEHACLGALAVDADRLRPAASVMKLALVAAILREHELGRLDLGSRFPASAFGQTRFPSVLAAFDRDHSFTLREICRLALVTSDNPMAVFLSEICAISRVVETLEALAIPKSRFRLEAGYSDPELGPANRRNLITAADSLILLRHLCRYPDIAAALENNLRNTRIPALLPDGARVAHKSGTLDGVANDVGRITSGRTRIWIAFLTEHEIDLEEAALEIARCARDVLELVAGWEGSGGSVHTSITPEELADAAA